MSTHASDPNTTRVSADRLRAFCRRILAAAEVPDQHAETIAHALVESDLRGIHTHGVNLFPRYIRGFMAGELNRTPSLQLLRDRGSIAVLDADNTLGHVAGKRAMEIAIDKARLHGVGMVAVRNSNHFGAAAYFTMMAPPHGMIGYCTTNAPAVMAPWGGREAVLGNNPLSYAIPTGKDSPPIVLDMACTVSARGKIRLAAQRGDRIPLGWAVDALGRPTEDPNEALGGLLLPVGEHKGSGLAIVSEVLAAVLAGANATLDVSRAVLSGGEVYDSQRIGHFMMALDVEAFLPRVEYEGRVQRVISHIRASELAPGTTRIVLPGEPEQLYRERYLENGIPLSTATMKQLANLAQELGVEPLS